MLSGTEWPPSKERVQESAPQQTRRGFREPTFRLGLPSGGFTPGGVYESYADDIRARRHGPHPRHWNVLANWLASSGNCNQVPIVSQKRVGFEASLPDFPDRVRREPHSQAAHNLTLTHRQCSSTFHVQSILSASSVCFCLSWPLPRAFPPVIHKQ